MKTKKMYSNTVFFFIGLFILITSCEKTREEIVSPEEATIVVNLEGINYESEEELYASTPTTSDEKEIPTHIQYVDKDFHIESQLIPVKENNKELLKGKNQNVAAVRSELGNNIRYTLLVYNNQTGNLVASKDYVYKQETNQSSIVLNTYDTYTFIVVSARSTSTVPTIQNVNKLSTATIKDVNADLLYWSKTTKLSKGQNYLAAILKPKFSEITTTLRMDQTMTGSITAISTTQFNPVVNNVSLKLSDGNLTYGTVSTTGKTVTFPSLGNGLRTITATPTTLIHSQTNSANLKFQSITVDGETKSNITVSGLSIKPGYRYNLILTLKTCTEAVSGNGFNWAYEEKSKSINEGSTWWPNYVTYKGIEVDGTFKKNGEVISFQFTEKGADYGFIYDITELDNAFNLEINGQPLYGTDITKHEIQFQSNATASTQNIEFEDGSQYQTSQVPSIWTLIGNNTNPIVRVVIGRNGDVLMYGSKYSKGPLLPLRLKSTAQFKNFNTITWKGGNQTNIIKATARIEGKTVMKANGSGRKKVSCTQ